MPLLPPEPSELQRSIDRLESTLNSLVDKLVHRDVYDADQRTSKLTLDDLKGDVESLGEKIDKMEERRASERRAYLTSLVIPALLLVFQVYLYSRVGG